MMLPSFPALREGMHLLPVWINKWRKGYKSCSHSLGRLGTSVKVQATKDCVLIICLWGGFYSALEVSCEGSPVTSKFLRNDLPSVPVLLNCQKERCKRILWCPETWWRFVRCAPSSETCPCFKDVSILPQLPNACEVFYCAFAGFFVQEYVAMSPVVCTLVVFCACQMGSAFLRTVLLEVALLRNDH